MTDQGPAPLAPRNYYKCMLRSLSYRELWRLSNWKTFPFFGVMKILGMDLLLSQGTPEPVSLDGMRVDRAQIDPSLCDALDKLVEECMDLGFSRPIYYQMVDELVAGNECAAAICIHAHHETVANFMVVKSSQNWRRVTSFLSAYSDGLFFSSDNDKPGFMNPRGDGALHLLSKPGPEVFCQHEKARKKWARSRLPLQIANEAELTSVLYAYDLHRHNWHVRRGIYVKMTPEEVESARRQKSSAATGGKLEELSLRLMLVGEENPSKIALGSTAVATLIADAVRATTPTKSQWNLHFATTEGETSLDLTIHGSIAAAAEGERFKSTLKCISKSGQALLEQLSNLLAVRAPAATRKHQSVNAELVLESRDGSFVEELKAAGEYLFQMRFEGVPGSMRFILHPALSEARLQPDESLDRAAALERFAALLA